MAVVRISDQSLACLGTLGLWFHTPTPSLTIDRLVQNAMRDLGLEREPLPEVKEDFGAPIKVYTTIPNDSVAFTKVVAAKVGGLIIKNPTWSSVLIACVRRLAQSGLKGEALKSVVSVPTRLGCYEGEGFRFYADLDLSVQGQSAVDACQHMCVLARQHGFGLAVDFVWRDNPRALYRGVTGRIEINA
jgi:hypothetical protein